VFPFGVHLGPMFLRGYCLMLVSGSVQLQHFCDIACASPQLMNCVSFPILLPFDGRSLTPLSPIRRFGTGGWVLGGENGFINYNEPL